MTASFTLMTQKTIAKLELAGVDAIEVAAVVQQHRMAQRNQGGRYVQPKREAIRAAVKHMSGCKAMTAVVSVVMNPDDSVDCIKIGKRGGVTLLANLLDRRGLAA
jgi:hypothetical protein